MRRGPMRAALAAAWGAWAAQEVELLRYVTPYGTDLDVLVDVSPYAELLQRPAVRLYSFVDTWVGNHTAAEVWSERAEGSAETCELRRLEGNGWALHAELLYFAPERAAGTVLPAVSPAPWRAPPPELGRVEVAGPPSKGQGFLRKEGAAEVFSPCAGAADVQRALRDDWARSRVQAGADANATRYTLLRQDLTAPAKVLDVDAEQRTVRVKLSGSGPWGVGDAVYLEKRTGIETEDGDVVNGVAPLEPAGHVLELSAGEARVQMRDGCLPQPGWELRTARAADKPGGGACSLEGPAPGPARLVAAAVDVGAPLADNERVRVRVVATGHGWSFTDEHCGEYCRMEFAVSVDGEEAGRFRPWREDCAANPNGHLQHGTWKTSRNGWCPGAVSDGWWADVTDLVKRGGTVQVALDGVVEGRAAYNNSAGFAFGEKAVVQAAVTLFREPSEAIVRRATDRTERVHFAAPWFEYDAASAPAPEFRVPVFTGELHQVSSRKLEHEVALPRELLEAGRAHAVALRLRLTAPPPPLEVDRWDRFATFGVLA